MQLVTRQIELQLTEEWGWTGNSGRNMLRITLSLVLLGRLAGIECCNNLFFLQVTENTEVFGLRWPKQDPAT